MPTFETSVGDASQPLNLSQQGKKVDGLLAVAEGKVTAHHGPHDFMAGMAAAALSYVSPTLSVFVGAVAAAMSGTKSHFAQTSENFKEVLTRSKKNIESIPMGSELPKQQAAPKPPATDIFARSKIASASLKAIKNAKVNIAHLKRERDTVQKLKEGLNRFDNLNRLQRAVVKGSQVAQQVVKKNPNLKQRINSRFAPGIKV